MRTNGTKLTMASLAMILLMGCTQNQILATLEASVAATESLVASLQVAGKLSAATADEIETAIAGLPVAYRETAAELASSDNAAVKAAKVTGYYSATIVALRMLPPEAQIYAAAISTSIEAFLLGLQPAQATGSLATRVESGKFDAKRLNAIGCRAVVLGVQIAELKTNAEAAGEKGTR